MEAVVEMFRKLGLRQVLVTRDGYVASFTCSIVRDLNRYAKRTLSFYCPQVTF
jgi:hypothetical protein